MRIKESRPDQRGIASVELALILPIILILIVLLFAVAAAFRTKFDTLETARIAAWRHATGTGVWFGKNFPIDLTFRGDPMRVKAESLKLEPSADLLARMRARGKHRYWDTDRLTAVLKVEGHSGSWGEAWTLFIPAQRFDFWPLTVTSRYALVTGPAWEGRTMPIGYDNYLKRKLNSSVVMPTIFPCAGGPVNSGTSRCR